MRRRFCVKCGAEFIPGSPIAKYCGSSCRPRNRGSHPKASAASRGYGPQHQAARRAALARLRDGDPCTRCGGPMLRAQARQLDLDHSDDRRSYLGLAHAKCNRRAGAVKGAMSRHKPLRRVPAPSREW